MSENVNHYLEILEIIAEKSGYGVMVLCQWEDMMTRKITPDTFFQDARSNSHRVVSCEPAGDGLYLVRFSAESAETLARTFRAVQLVHGDRLRPREDEQ